MNQLRPAIRRQVYRGPTGAVSLTILKPTGVTVFTQIDQGRKVVRQRITGTIPLPTLLGKSCEMRLPLD